MNLLYLINLLNQSSSNEDIIISAVIVVLIAVFFFVFSKKIITVLVISLILAGSILFFVFDMKITALILLSIFIICSIMLVFANISEFRHLFMKPQQKKNKVSERYSKEELYQVIDETVHSLSRSKTGAIMTFERSTNLDEIMKSGTIINAPVSQELLETIFYEGTRLHDGAVVIRGNIIVAASVYYTPTTRALTGKYGSRHRAAFGISEISDSVTVVVSEETGRVSLAYSGNLEAVQLDSFLREFTDVMNSTK